MKKKLRKVPVKELKAKVVSAERFNDLIDYYTAELNSRFEEIAMLREQLDVVTRASVRREELRSKK